MKPPVKSTAFWPVSQVALRGWLRQLLPSKGLMLQASWPSGSTIVAGLERA